MHNDHLNSIPLAARKSRRFSIKALVATLHPAGAVTVGAFAYALDANDNTVCLTTAVNTTVRLLGPPNEGHSQKRLIRLD